MDPHHTPSMFSYRATYFPPPADRPLKSTVLGLEDSELRAQGLGLKVHGSGNSFNPRIQPPDPLLSLEHE